MAAHITRIFYQTSLNSMIDLTGEACIPKGSKFHCCKQGSLLPKLKIDNKFRGLYNNFRTIVNGKL